MQIMTCRCCNAYNLRNTNLRSCQNKSCDFWLWGNLKSPIYRGNPQSLPALKNTIRQVTATIFAYVLFHAVSGVIPRLYSVLECCEGTLEFEHRALVVVNHVSFFSLQQRLLLLRFWANYFLHVIQNSASWWIVSDISWWIASRIYQSQVSPTFRFFLTSFYFFSGLLKDPLL